MNQQDLGAIARTIIEANMYMVLGTADKTGRPWVSPVYYASAGYNEFYWVSSPEARHSRNLATRPQVSIVIFDSQAPIGIGQGVYMSAVAEELTDIELELEPVCKIRKEENGSESNHGRKISGSFFITSGNATKLL